MTVAAPLTLFDKIWSRHEVLTNADGQSLVYIDCHLVHEGSREPFETLRSRGLRVRNPEQTFATPDHYVPSASIPVEAIDDPERRTMIETLSRNAVDSGMTLFDIRDRRHGIVHVIGPEQGLSQPGATIACGDSHTSTHGAVGALAFGVGNSEVSHVLATQTLWLQKPKNMRILIDGELRPGVTAKDLILTVIATIGTAGATGHVVEYAGDAVSALSMAGRLTLCNMSIEAGARAGLIAPDEKTLAYIFGRPFAPKGADWERAAKAWLALVTDDGAVFDSEVRLDAATVEPTVTWGTSPQDAAPISGAAPDPATETDPARREGMANALRYMGLEPGTPLENVAVEYVFIGSCTNGRLEDLRAAAAVVRGRRVAPGVTAWVVPGSGLIKAEAEAEGLDRLFVEAGFEWREPGCSMCLATNGDRVPPGKRCASTSNRNFVGRQGPGARTHLMSPAMAAAAAVEGRLTDFRRLVGTG
jgi:3-isopropylmalate/(R)-2-methylmalate dehydratase large subunit